MIYAWGHRYYHQLGDGLSREKKKVAARPLLVEGLDEETNGAVANVSASLHASFILTDMGRVLTWGTLFEEVVPIPSLLTFPSSDVTIVQMSCGKKHVLLLSSDGEVYSYGSGMFGRLGHGDEVSFTKPRKVRSVRRAVSSDEDTVAAVSAGGAHSSVLTAKGRVYMWGFNRQGQCAHPRTGCVLAPHRIALPQLSEDEYVSQIVLGRGHSAILTTHGKLFTWGATSYGRLGYRSSSKLVGYPKFVGKLAGKEVHQYACGDFHSVVVMKDGSVRTWGRGDDGQLGHGTTFHSSTPRRVLALDGLFAAQVAAGPYTSMVVTSHGELLVWGRKYGGAGFAYESSAESSGSEMHLHPHLVQDMTDDADCVFQSGCGGAHMLALVSGYGEAQGEFPGTDEDQAAEPVHANDEEVKYEQDTSATESEDAIDTISAAASIHHRNKLTYYPPSSAERPKTASPRTEQAFSFCRHNRNKELAEMLENGFDPDRKDANGNSLLIVAAQNNLKRAAKLLISHGADLDATNSRGQTALHYAFKYGFLDLFEHLSSEGASQTIQNHAGLTCFEGLTPADLEDDDDY